MTQITNNSQVYLITLCLRKFPEKCSNAVSETILTCSFKTPFLFLDVSLKTEQC